MPKSERVLYRLLPKCACSSIEQLLYFSDHGHFLKGEFHNLKTGLHKWDFDHGMDYIFDHLSPNHRPQHASHTQFNKVTDSSNLPLEAYFDQTALFLMEGIYQQDFELFGYRLNDPKNANPEREIHLDNLHTDLLENPG